MAWAFSDQWGDYQLWQGHTDTRSAAVYTKGLNTNLVNASAFDYFSDTAEAGAVALFGLGRRSWGIRLFVGTPFEAAAVTFVWEYSIANNNWQPLAVTNGDAMLASGQQDITWNPPSNWDSCLHTGYAESTYYVRCRIEAVTGLVEGGAQSTQRVQFNHKALVATGTETGLATAVDADIANGWGIISETEGGGAYRIATNLRIGDGSTTTTVTLSGLTIVFEYGCYLYVDNAATLTLGTLSNEGLWDEKTSNGCTIRETVCTNAGVGYHAVLRNRGTGVLNVYCSHWILRMGGYSNGYPFHLNNASGLFKAVDTTFQAVSGGWAQMRVLVTQVVLRRVVFSGVLSMDVTANASFDTVRAGMIYLATAVGLILRNVRITSAYVWSTAYNRYLTLLDTDIPTSAITPGWSGTQTGEIVRIAKTFSLQVVGPTGDPIDDVTVQCLDAQGRVAVNTQTGVDGHITPQYLDQYMASHAAGAVVFTWELRTPHTVTLSKEGYKTRVLQYTMDQARDEVEMLEAYAPVVADFDVGPAEAENEVQFADASTVDLAEGDTASYAWDFGDTGTSSERNPRHEYAAAGTYDVTLTVTTSWGGVDSDMLQVVVDPLQPPRVITAIAASVVPSEAVAVVVARTEAIAAVVGQTRL